MCPAEAELPLVIPGNSNASWNTELFLNRYNKGVMSQQVCVVTDLWLTFAGGMECESVFCSSLQDIT
ncbi:hypothetical protein QQF64_014035 [Cirrhinus molitorella]|uniref:Uncharacterized protein n=1 Tax=Cirrhinus molitorella TaxID=172907 RepID=A0ABR3LWB5_9TELE